MLEIFWISDDGWGKQTNKERLPDDVRLVSQEEYMKHEAEQMASLYILPETPKKKPAKKTTAKKAAPKKKTTGRKKVAAPKKEAAEDGS